MKLIWRYSVWNNFWTLQAGFIWVSITYIQKQILNQLVIFCWSGQRAAQKRFCLQSLWCLVWCKIVKFEAISADIQCNYQQLESLPTQDSAHKKTITCSSEICYKFQGRTDKQEVRPWILILSYLITFIC